MTSLDRLNLQKFGFMQNQSGGKIIIKFQQSQALTSHFEIFWSIVLKLYFITTYIYSNFQCKMYYFEIDVNSRKDLTTSFSWTIQKYKPRLEKVFQHLIQSKRVEVQKVKSEPISCLISAVSRSNQQWYLDAKSLSVL